MCEEEKQIVKIYHVTIGTPASPSPNGEFRITKQIENSSSSKPGVVIGPGTDNPLGTRSRGLNVKGRGIDDTHRPDSIGHKASHGPVRLRNREAEELFARVKVEDHISLITERSEVAQIFGPVRGSSSTLAAGSEVRFSSAEEQSSDR